MIRVRLTLINRLARILRACASTHVFDNPSEGHYSHNGASRAFLKEQNRDMFQQMYDFVGKGTYALPQFLKLTNWKNPNDYNDSAFHLGQNTKLGFWEYLKEDPERMRLFNSGMRSVATIGGENKSSGPFPFETLVGADPSEQITVVDVGGGRGQALEAIHENYPSIKWNMILQDQPDVVEDAKAKGLPTYIQGQGGSFFEPQPVKGMSSFRRLLYPMTLLTNIFFKARMFISFAGSFTIGMTEILRLSWSRRGLPLAPVLKSSSLTQSYPVLKPHGIWPCRISI